MEVSSLAMSVSLPGTIVIVTQTSGLAALKLSTMVCSPSESGGVCCVQKATAVAPSAQAAGVSWALVSGALPAVMMSAVTVAVTSQREILVLEVMISSSERMPLRLPPDVPSSRESGIPTQEGRRPGSGLQPGAVALTSASVRLLLPDCYPACRQKP